MVLTSEPAHGVTIAITRSGDGDIGVDNQELTFTDSDWDTAQTVTVSVASEDDDAIDDTGDIQPHWQPAPMRRLQRNSQFRK